ncbi:hypothetical protein EV200_11199 [Pedobacter psychrotolerans]|uniref:Uncharacterized protein n=1 Tax=Pedobacter psychrotolerans TaxID=1843235 RepID=A0A4R2H2D7_9SPHI|nr:hypothetical protein EV200_11199 [Pedobacter psychrotolerans]
MKNKSAVKKLVLNKRTVVNYHNLQNYSAINFSHTITTLPPTVTGIFAYTKAANIGTS